MQITPEGLERLKKKLEKLTTQKRREISQRIQSAKELGDLSENAEYQEAKEAQALNESHIAQLQEKIKNAQIIIKHNSNNKVQLDSKVVVQDDLGQKIEFTIVNIQESDPMQGKISNESPLGKQLLGKAKGEKIKATMPNGKIKHYKIIQIK